jgi:pyridoxal phosphate enzyme (YggS family)
MLAKRFAEIRERIGEAAVRSGRTAEDVTLVAVSKYVSPTLIQEALGLGQKVFGENYVQEGCSKKEAFGSGIEIHLIGNLQRNKVKKAVGTFDLIHTIDRIEVAQEISKVAAKRECTQCALIQVNISGEESKSGVRSEALFELFERSIELPALQIRGLMSIGSWDQGDSVRIAEFEALSGLREQCESNFGISLPDLSMGMSEDFEIAIEHGATLVRVGSALFGERE